ncbi:MAG: di-heme oxidoredictase family protein [bacterium]
MGLSELVTGNGETSYLHDGRARTLEEANLWHGGEANQSRQEFVQLSSEERYHLIQFSFLRSL